MNYWDVYDWSLKPSDTVESFYVSLTALLRDRCENAKDMTDQNRHEAAHQTLQDWNWRCTNRARIRTLLEEKDRADVEELILFEIYPPEREPARSFDDTEFLPKIPPRLLTTYELQALVSGEMKFTEVIHPLSMPEAEARKQVNEYLEVKHKGRADENVKVGFQQAIEQVPSTFFDIPYGDRFSGNKDCALIAFGYAEGLSYREAAAQLEVKGSRFEGISGMDLKEMLEPMGYNLSIVAGDQPLKTVWNSEVIGSNDSGIIAVGTTTESQHALGFRSGRIGTSDALTLSQAYESAPVKYIWFRNDTSETAMQRAAERLALKRSGKSEYHIINEVV